MIYVVAFFRACKLTYLHRNIWHFLAFSVSSFVIIAMMTEKMPKDQRKLRGFFIVTIYNAYFCKQEQYRLNHFFRHPFPKTLSPSQKLDISVSQEMSNF